MQDCDMPKKAKKQKAKENAEAALAKIRATRAAIMRRYRAKLKAKKNV